MNAMKIEVIDFKQIFGAKIDREDNRVSGLSIINSKRKNFDGYVPNNVEYGDMISMNI